MGALSGQGALPVYIYLIFTAIIISIFQVRKLKIRNFFGSSSHSSLEAPELSTTTCLLPFASVQRLLIAHSAKFKLLRETHDPLMAWPLLYLVPPLSPLLLETDTLLAATAVSFTFQEVSGLLLTDHISPLPGGLSPQQTYLTDN